MKVKFYGTRGSVPISNSESVKFGGNTTSLRVFSECMPPGMVLAIDAGTGFVPLCREAMNESGLREILTLFTHFHHDHTQGLLLAPPTFIPAITKRYCGPKEMGIGPKEMIEAIMKPPLFPVPFKRVASHHHFNGLEVPQTTILLVHPEGGYKFMEIHHYEQIIKEGRYLPIGKGKYPENECLVVTMYKSNHPEQTISYRFQEKPTDRVFVIMTDHENEAGIPQELKRHLKGVNLLVMDAQYSHTVYETRTAGFGHGTPDYCVHIAEEVGAQKLGLTHHDPGSTDKAIENILEEAKGAANGNGLEIFACCDYQEIEI